MSKYTTGEIAKLCKVTVRTVQYYDTRNILVPSELSEGGRRLYSEDDLKRMKIICFLRELDIPIKAISQLLADEDPGNVINILLEQQLSGLQNEIRQKQETLSRLKLLQRELKTIEHFSVESIGDIAKIMQDKQNIKKLHRTILFTAIPMGILQWSSIILWIVTGIWWPFTIYACAAIPYVIRVSRYYFNRVSYICPQCHNVFSPRFREAFWAHHTFALRKLTCPGCRRRGWCVEVYGGGEK